MWLCLPNFNTEENSWKFSTFIVDILIKYTKDVFYNIFLFHLQDSSWTNTVHRQFPIIRYLWLMLSPLLCSINVLHFSSKLQTRNSSSVQFEQCKLKLYNQGQIARRKFASRQCEKYFLSILSFFAFEDKSGVWNTCRSYIQNLDRGKCLMIIWFWGYFKDKSYF